MTGPVLRAEGLEVHGLEPATFEIASGECLALQGPSGSGKTLLLRAIADLDPAPGRVWLGETERGAISGPAWRKRVRYLAAEPGWWADTPREHFAKGEGVAELIATLGLTAAQLDQSLSRLSTGERQRMALARAILDSPEVLLLDEPTGALDAKATARAEKLIGKQLRSGRAVILVSHDSNQLDRLANRKLTIRGGKVREGRK